MMMMHEQAAEQKKTRKKELSCEPFYKIRLVYVFLRLSSKVSHFVSSLRFRIDTNLVQPVTILAASFCILSSSDFSYRVQLSHIDSLYSNIGLMKLKYIICNDFLSNSNFSFLMAFTRFQAFSLI